MLLYFLCVWDNSYFQHNTREIKSCNNIFNTVIQKIGITVPRGTMQIHYQQCYNKQL